MKSLLWVNVCLLAFSGYRCNERILDKLNELRSELEVIVAMTTTPSRIHSGSLEEAIAGIFKQSFTPDRIVLALPRGPLVRRPTEHYPEDEKLPLFLAQPRDGLVVDRTCPDEGPGTMLYCALRHVQSPEAYVIVLGDDIVYSTHHLAILLHVAADPYNRGVAVSVTGLHSSPWFAACFDHTSWTSGCLGRRNYGQSFGPLTIGWMGTVVRPWFFGPSGRHTVADQRWPDSCRLHDDLWLGAVLALRGIRRKSGNYGLIGQAKDVDSGNSGSALYGGNRYNLLDCNKALITRWPSLWKPTPRVICLVDKQTADLGYYNYAHVTRCAGRIDDWYGVGTSHWDGLRRVVRLATSRESMYTIALVLMMPPSMLVAESEQEDICKAISLALQCAMVRPEYRCKSGRKNDGALVAAASLSAWRDTASRVLHKSLSSFDPCWAGKNRSWALCCASQGDSALAAPRLQRLRCHGIPRFCCVVHSRLNMRWAPLEGLWRMQYIDGSVGEIIISAEGQVYGLESLHRCTAGITEETMSTCCPRHCGKCGGVGCSERPGGGRNCCGGSIKTHCQTAAGPPPCIYPTSWTSSSEIRSENTTTVLESTNLVSTVRVVSRTVEWADEIDAGSQPTLLELWHVIDDRIESVAVHDTFTRTGIARREHSTIGLA